MSKNIQKITLQSKKKSMNKSEIDDKEMENKGEGEVDGKEGKYMVTKDGMRFRLKKRSYQEMVNDGKAVRQEYKEMMKEKEKEKENIGKTGGKDDDDNENNKGMLLNESDDDEEIFPIHQQKRFHSSSSKKSEYKNKLLNDFTNDFNNNEKISQSITNDILNMAIHPDDNPSTFHFKASINKPQTHHRPTGPIPINNLLSSQDQLPPSLKSNQESLIKESDRIKSLLSNYALTFKQEKIPQLITLISKTCTKLRSKKQLAFRVTDFFKGTTLSLSRTYPSSTSPINYEASILDTLIASNSIYDPILIVNDKSSSIVNLLLYFFSNIIIINIGNILLPFIDFALDTSRESKDMTCPNVDNIFNASMEMNLNNLFGSLKMVREQVPFKEINSKLAKDYMMNFFNKTIIEIFKSKEYDGLEKIGMFNFDMIAHVFQNNPSFLISQLNTIDINTRLNQQAYERIIEYKERMKKVYKLQQLNNQLYNMQVNMLFDLKIFYVNTADLIVDFLNCEDVDDDDDKVTIEG